MGQGGLGQVEHGEDVGAEDPLQLLGGDVGDAVGGVLLGRVVDQHGQAAQLAHRPLHGLATELLVAHVAGQGQAAPALGLYSGGCRCR